MLAAIKSKMSLFNLCELWIFSPCFGQFFDGDAKRHISDTKAMHLPDFKSLFQSRGTLKLFKEMSVIIVIMDKMMYFSLGSFSEMTEIPGFCSGKFQTKWLKIGKVISNWKQHVTLERVRAILICGAIRPAYNCINVKALAWSALINTLINL